MAALESLGNEVEVCDARYKPFGSRFLFRVCRRLFLGRFPTVWDTVVKISSQHTQQRVLRMAKKFKPDIFFAVKAKEIKPETIRKIHDMGIVTANWYMEGIWHKSPFIFGPVYDYFFNVDKGAISILRERGVKHAHYVAFGTRLVPSQVNNTLERSYDISFIGTPTPPRPQILGMLSDLDINIWGPPAMWEKTSLMKFYRGKAYGSDLDNIYQRTKIVVNTNYENIKTNSPNLRNFEVMGNGALLISDYKADFAEMFSENKEFVFYRDIKEIPALVSYYLKNEEERSVIAKAGQTAVLAKHTIESRVRDMMQIIKAKH